MLRSFESVWGCRAAVVWRVSSQTLPPSEPAAAASRGTRLLCKWAGGGQEGHLRGLVLASRSGETRRGERGRPAAGVPAKPEAGEGALCCGIGITRPSGPGVPVLQSPGLSGRPMPRSRAPTWAARGSKGATREQGEQASRGCGLCVCACVDVLYCVGWCVSVETSQAVQSVCGGGTYMPGRTAGCLTMLLLSFCGY